MAQEPIKFGEIALYKDILIKKGINSSDLSKEAQSVFSKLEEKSSYNKLHKSTDAGTCGNMTNKEQNAFLSTLETSLQKNQGNSQAALEDFAKNTMGVGQEDIEKTTKDLNVLLGDMQKLQQTEVKNIDINTIPNEDVKTAYGFYDTKKNAHGATASLRTGSVSQTNDGIIDQDERKALDTALTTPEGKADLRAKLVDKFSGWFTSKEDGVNRADATMAKLDKDYQDRKIKEEAVLKGGTTTGQPPIDSTIPTPTSKLTNTPTPTGQPPIGPTIPTPTSKTVAWR